ncbi:hypothetical protein [Aeromicrobium sp.]|uniref:hypothetical protein n=1 Tax=Aeromicrobium sp. TaxID=1871063 RepID=UPI0030C2C9C4
MKTVATLALLAILAACGSSSEDEPAKPKLSAEKAAEQTCTEVNAGIEEFNQGDYAGTVTHFEKAKITAKVYAMVSDEPEADALLDAVQYYANLDPADYPEAARSSENFARNKAITLNQCADADDGTDGQKV